MKKMLQNNNLHLFCGESSGDDGDYSGSVGVDTGCEVRLFGNQQR